MDERIARRLAQLRRLRLLRAQRRWRELREARRHLQQLQADLEHQCMAVRGQRAHCLRHAEAGAPGHAFALAQAAALARQATRLEHQADTASRQLAALAVPLAAARQALHKAQRLMDDARTPGAG